jgi:hypothetical protein
MPLSKAAIRKTGRRTHPSSGIGVDEFGAPAVDPTQNVIALTEAANLRQDDLRRENNARVDVEVRRLEQLSALRAEHSKTLIHLHAVHSKELSALESNRLNAIRQVDVLAVNTAADRAAAAIQALAATTAANADNLRNALTATAATIATQTAGIVTAITERIAALEKSSYEGKGKQAVADPLMDELVREMKSLRESRATGAGKGEGVNAAWMGLLGAVTLIATLIAIFSFARSSPDKTPQIIYVPAPQGTQLPVAHDQNPPR